MSRPRCCVCGKMRKNTTHHVVPKTHGGKRNKANRLSICRDCHDDLEKFIRILEGMKDGKRIKRSDKFYRECVKFFIQWRYHETKRLEEMEPPTDNGGEV